MSISARGASSTPRGAGAGGKPETNAPVILSARGSSSTSRNQAEEKGVAVAPMSARQQQVSARGAGSEAKGTAREGLSMTARVEAMDTGRDYMSTARMHTALAALTAERSELLNKLAFIDSTLEAEGKKKLMKTRGFMKPSHIGQAK